HEFLATAIQQQRLRLGVILHERAEGAQVVRADDRRVLYFDCHEPEVAVDHEVDFDAVTRSPEEELRVAGRIRDPCAKVLCDEAFERCSRNFRWTIERAARPQGTKDSRVEEIELRLLRRLPFRAPREHRKTERE